MAEHPDERLESLFRIHYEDVLRYCARRIGRSEAEEAAAEVFAIAWRKVDEIVWDSARPWLFGVARKVLANRWRHLKRTSRLAEKVSALAPNPPETPDFYVLGRSDDTEAMVALRKLGTRDQEILRLAAWEELTAPEIAKVLTISNSAAEQRLHRAKARYARALDLVSNDDSPRAVERRGEADVD